MAAGILGVYWSTHGTRVGPSLTRPFGKTSIAPPVTSSPSTTTTTRPAGGATSTTVSLGVTTRAVEASLSTPVSPAPWQSHGLEAHKTKIVAAPFVKRSIPLHITIPKIGVSAHLTELGLNKNRTVEVPTQWAIPGWYKYGPTPGQEGSAVILGHVDSTQGPAVFYRLADLRLGNLVYVREADGKTLHFAVIGLREYSKKDFPDKLVYGPRKYAALQLVTCGGVFDPQTGHYLSNIVVFTTLVK